MQKWPGEYKKAMNVEIEYASTHEPDTTNWVVNKAAA